MLAVVRPADPVMRDRLLAALAFVAMAIELLASGGSVGDELRSVLFAGLFAAPLLWWRTRPEICAIAVALVLLVANAGAAPDRVNDASTPLIPILVSIFGLALYGTGRPLRIAAPLVLVLLCVGASLAESDVAGNIVFVVAFVFAPTFLAGRVIRTRTRLNHELAVRARALEADREERIRRAAAEERVRIAGELHDVVAHGVSSMVVQAAAARRLAPRDPGTAEQAIALIEQTGRDALLEMRRLLGVLRRGDEDLALSPPPSLSRAGMLVERARGAGREVRLNVEGDAVPIPAGLDVAGYRVLEEALAAAPSGPATVSVRWHPRELELEVVAAEVSPDTGPDLLGLRERVALFGGELAAGSRGSGYTVRVRLPLSGGASA
jgi:signal transduction histidine kinase